LLQHDPDKRDEADVGRSRETTPERFSTLLSAFSRPQGEANICDPPYLPLTRSVQNQAGTARSRGYSPLPAGGTASA
jgi:hypothetical protein